MGKKYIVYQHRNKINDKKYIGITSLKPQKRYGKDGHKYVMCPYFYAAIQKYGWSNFEHTILFQGLTYEQACAKQIELIKQLDLTNHQKGYNLSRGGDGIDPAISASLWEREGFKEYASSRMRQAWKDPQKRKRRSDAAKERWADEQFKNRAMSSVIQACRKSVRCVQTGQIFYSMKQAAQKYNVIRSNISRSIRKGFRCGGYHWEYVDDISETLTTIETVA